MDKPSRSYLDILNEKRPEQESKNVSRSENKDKTERYKEIYEELKIKMNPIFEVEEYEFVNKYLPGTYSEPRDLGEMIKGLAGFFSKDKNYPMYIPFLKKYDRSKKWYHFREEAIEVALKHITKKRK